MYITQIGIVKGNNNEIPEGYTGIVPEDLNKWSAGDELHLCYKKEEVKLNEEAIVDIFVVDSEVEKAPDGYHKLKISTNDGGTGDTICIYYKKSSEDVEKSGITDITVLTGKNPKIPEGYTVDWTDMNANSGGEYLYLAFKQNEIYKEAKARYKIEIHTGDIAFASTDANISLKLKGEKSDTKFYIVNDIISENSLDRNEIAVVNLDTDERYIDLGSIKNIALKSDMKFAGAGWYVDSVKVFEARGLIKEFKIDSWIKDTDEHIF